jgi:hypothetical protein
MVIAIGMVPPTVNNGMAKRSPVGGPGIAARPKHFAHAIGGPATDHALALALAENSPSTSG